MEKEKNRDMFFIVGAQRSGTTYLYNIFNEHPEICMNSPAFPEPKEFLKSDFIKKDYEEKYFKLSNNFTKIYGDKSTSYYEYEDVAKSISETYANSKIIFIIRNPVIRALSNYFFSKSNNIENRSLEDVFLKEKSEPQSAQNISVNPFKYIERGYYHQYISTYLKYFDKKNVKIIVLENLINGSYNINDLYDFLDVSHNIINKEINTNSNGINYSQISSKIIEKLNSHYVDTIKKTEKIIGENLDVWR